MRQKKKTKSETPLAVSIARQKLGRGINFRAVLHNVAKTMVRLKKPGRLLKIIIRYVDREFDLTHTSFLVFEEKKDRYVFFDSKGTRRFPLGLIRFDRDHPLIAWFDSSKKNRLPKDYLDRTTLKKCSALPDAKFPDAKDNIKELIDTLNRLSIELVIPAYFKKHLQGLLLFGRKKNKKKFTPSEIAFFQILAHDCSMAIKTAEYHQSLVDQNTKLSEHLKEIEKLRRKEQETYYEVIRSLAQEIKAKDPYTFGHISQVEKLGLMTATELKLNLSGKRKDVLRAGLLLHDVGKIGIPDAILLKPAKLDETEWQVMKTHAEKGAGILEHLSDFKDVAEIVKSHHERVDGSGYPRGLSGESIPIEARIVAVVDSFDAIVSTRCYSKSKPVDFAFKELRRCAGTQFDAKVVEAFIRAYKKQIGNRGLAYYQEPVDS